MAKQKCGCKPFAGFLGLILIAAGIYFLVWGFIDQTSNAISWNIWNMHAGLLYLIGAFLFGFGKMLKHKGYGCCKVHGMCEFPTKR
jgi:uncharacterized membrane protein YedE/YeeE